MRNTVLVLLLCAACSDADSAWQGRIETLPNGATRVTNTAQGMWRTEDTWRLEPELAIGDVDGAEATTFAQIIALAVGDDGRIYVLDRQLNELRIFDATGAHERTVGRVGEGPGEYRAANGLSWLAPDSLVVIDQQGARYSVLNRAGDYIRSVQRVLPFYAWSFQGGLRHSRVYEQSAVGEGEEQRPALLGVSLSGDHAAIDTVVLPLPGVPTAPPFSFRNERGGMSIGVPFAGRPVYRLHDGDGLWHGHGSAYRIYRSRLAGDTLAEVVLDVPPVPVGDAEIAEWEQSEFVLQFRERGGRIERERIPRVKPYFDDLFLDDAGFLWTAVTVPSGDAAFDVFDADGRYLGRLQLAGVKRDPYVSPVVRAGRLYLIGRDALDVQRVMVFRIEDRGVVSPAERRM